MACSTQKQKLDRTASARSGMGKWCIFAMCAIPYFFAHFHRISSAVIASDLQHEFALSGSMLGLLTSAYFYAYAALQIPVGVMADRMSPRLIISVGMAVAAAGSFLLGMSQSYAWAVVARTLVGAGVAAIYVPSLKLLAGVFGSNQFATVSGLMIAVGNLGAICAGSPFAWLVSAMGWRESLLMIGVVSAVIALLCWQLLRGSCNNEPESRVAETSGKISGQGENSNPKERALDMNGAAFFLVLGLIMFLKYGPIMGYQGLWGIPYMTDVYGMSKIESSRVLMWIPIGYILGCPFMGWLGDKVGLDRYRLLILSNAVHLAAWVPMAWQTGQASIWGLSASSFLLGAMSGGSTVLIYSIVGKRAGNNGSGTRMGIVNACSLAGSAVFQPYMGLLVDRALNAGKSAIEAYGTAFRLAFFSIFVVLLLSTLIRRLSKSNG